jgi:hypothetical protein
MTHDELKNATPDAGWTITDTPPDPAVGQVWWDRDHRVSDRYAKVMQQRPDGKFVLRRGVDGAGNQSVVSADGLRRRWRGLTRTP